MLLVENVCCIWFFIYYTKVKTFPCLWIRITLPFKWKRDILISFLILMFSFQRLQAKILKVVDVSYGGENGFNQVSLHTQRSS